MSEARATIVVTPRDRFSRAQESLESIYANTEEFFDLVYVDGNSPPALRRALERQACERGFRLTRLDRYLCPNEARNIGFAAVDTEYVVFFDNDVVVRPGWLRKMIGCADETGAAAVTPLTCESGFETVHFAGGEVEIVEKHENGARGRHVRDEMYYAQRRLSSVQDELERRQVALCEFHCVLARATAVCEIGGLDEEMLSTREHLDFCLELARVGGTVWFEPESVVAYLPPPPLRPSDLHFFMLRWSDEWERRSLGHFQGKWELVEDEFFHRRLSRLGWRRQALIVDRFVRRATSGRGSRALERGAKAVERALNQRLASHHERVRERASA